MTPMGQLVDSIRSAVNDTSTVADQRIRSLIQEFYFDFCKMHDWLPLRRVKNMSFASATSAGLVLPSNLAGIKEVVDSDGIVFHLQETEDNQLVDGRCHAHYSQAATTPLEDRKGVSIDQDGTQMSFSAALSTQRPGEFIRFDKEPGCYEISSTANTLSAAYRGPRLQSVRFQIRPPTTRFLVLRDEDGVVDDSTVDVYYWIIPEPLYQDDQLILLPHTAALSIKVRTEYYMRFDSNGASKAKNIAGDFAGAWDDMLALDPKFMRPATARNKNGSRIYFGRTR